MRKFLTILAVVCAVTNLAAQQLYTDTFRIADQKTTADMDALLLDMVAQQSEMLHANDTVDTLTLAELMRLDSIEREIREVDSLKTMNAPGKSADYRHRESLGER